MDNIQISTVANGYIVEVDDYDKGYTEEHVFTVFQHLVDFLTKNLQKPASVVSQAH